MPDISGSNAPEIQVSGLEVPTHRLALDEGERVDIRLALWTESGVVENLTDQDLVVTLLGDLRLERHLLHPRFEKLKHLVSCRVRRGLFCRFSRLSVRQLSFLAFSSLGVRLQGAPDVLAYSSSLAYVPSNSARRGRA